MRLDISVVGKDGNEILDALVKTIADMRESNCVGRWGDPVVNYQFTDSDDVDEMDSEAKVIRPFPVKSC